MFAPHQREWLKRSWDSLMEEFGTRLDRAETAFHRLVAAYSEQQRFYHNLEHLFEMFEIAEQLEPEANGHAAVRLAIWFHDAVYDTHAKDSEARSAALAASMLPPLCVPQPVMDRVGQLIRATAHLADDRPPADRDTAILLDADLAILGAGADRYRRYAADVRREYAWVPDENFREGRSKVLETFLARPRIYWTDLLFTEREERARENMRDELASLASP